MPPSPSNRDLICDPYEYRSMYQKALVLMQRVPGIININLIPEQAQ